MLAKAPRPGLVKTRLTPAYTAAEAAELAAAALQDTLSAVAAAPARRRVLVLDGPSGTWARPGLEVVAQQGDGLDERLSHALRLHGGPSLLVGMDTPQVSPDDLCVDFEGVDAWFGPADDGGFWAIGFARRPDPRLLLGVPMSRPDTGARVLQRLSAAGLAVAHLRQLRDVDTPQDVATVAALAPAGRFAACAAALAVLR